MRIVGKLLTEPELARLLPQVYRENNNWVTFGTKCLGTNPCGTITEYPTKFIPEHYVTLDSISEWFKKAKPEPTNKDLSTQLGAHFEEVAELIKALETSVSEETKQVLLKAHESIIELSNNLYLSKGITLDKNASMDVLDALCDQVVTATGIAYMSKMKFDEALTEVNQSNFSKFENGKPKLNENGKIIKGKDYFKPNLEEFVND